MIDLRLVNDKKSELKIKLEDLLEILDVENLKEEIIVIEQEFTVEGFWNNHARAAKLTNKLGSLKHRLSIYEECLELFEEVEVGSELLKDEDEKLYLETLELISVLEDKIKSLVHLLLLKGKFDGNNAIMEIKAGAGGTEAQDWVEMLYRQFTRFFTRKGFSCKVIDYHAGDVAGIKSITLEIGGTDVFGFLKSESGVHRLIRISPFDSSGKRHTSFASVHVVPIIDDSSEIVIDKKDIKIDTFRASGAGGQSVNTTDSAVRITHLPTGIVVSCQNERSQIQNKEYALEMLKNKLAVLREEEQQKLIEKNSGQKTDNSWGSQIRTYVFQPYAMVKDHRTNYEVSNVKAVLDGDIDEFIIKYLEYINN